MWHQLCYISSYKIYNIARVLMQQNKCYLHMNVWLSWLKSFIFNWPQREGIQRLSILYVLLSALLHKYLIFCSWNICSVMHSMTLQIWVWVATESNWRWNRVCMTPTSLYGIENETFKNKMWPQNHLSVYLKPSQWSHGFDVCSGCVFTPFQMITFLVLWESVFYLFIMCVICYMLLKFSLFSLITNSAIVILV